MDWYKIAETSASKTSFLLLDLSYYPALCNLKKITNKVESFASYMDRKNNLVSEYMEERDKSYKANFGLSFFTETQSFKEYKLDVQGVINKVNAYKEKIDNIEIDNISINDIAVLFETGVSSYHKALGLFLVSQPEYTEKIESFIRGKLAKLASEEKVNEIFLKLISSDFKSCLEYERLDWLANISLPFLKKHNIFTEAKNDPILSEIIKEHVSKYKYYAASIEVGLWDEKHYWSLLKDDFIQNKSSLENELKNLKNRKNDIQEGKDEIIRKYNIDSEIIEIAEIISELGVLRIDLRVLGWQFFSYIFSILINISAKKLKLPVEQVESLSYSEYLKLLKDKSYTSDIFHKKKENLLVMVTLKNGYEVLRGEVADTTFKSEIYEKVKRVKKIKGVVAYEKGIVTGEVFKLDWSSKNLKQRISNFPANYILVAGQTRPLLMPAVRKAKAIITDEGGLLCHAAIVSRELGIPCIIGTKNATKILNDNDYIKVDTKKGIIEFIDRSK